MKNKKIKKLSKQLTSIMTKWADEREKSRNNRQEEKCCEEEPTFRKWGDYNLEVSNRFKKLVCNILNYPNNLNIDMTDNKIIIQVDDLTSIKKQTPQSYNSGSSGLKKGGDGDLRIEIIKTGFTIRYGYSKTSRYKDEKIFNELFDHVKIKLTEINSENFNNIWEAISKESGILRDSNLDDLIKEE